MSAPQEIGQIKELRPEEETYEMEAHHGEIDHDETIQQEAADPGKKLKEFYKKILQNHVQIFIFENVYRKTLNDLVTKFGTFQRSFTKIVLKLYINDII